MENKFRGMTLEETWAFVFSDGLSELDEGEQMQLTDAITSFGWNAGRMLDKVKGINPLAGKPTSYGTRNRKSYTYKVRKALGYTYP